MQPAGDRISACGGYGGGSMTAPLPILARDGEATTLKVAVYRSGKSDKTLRRWIKRFGIGHQPASGGPYIVSLVGLEMVRHGDIEALEMLRSGDRSSPQVRRYLDFMGLPAD